MNVPLLRPQEFEIPISERATFFSESELEIVRAISERPGKAKDIAKRIGFSNSSNFRILLANLIARRVLSIGADGYQLD